MVQALAFAELFAGGILFLCGFKGYSPAEVIKGEAGTAKPIGGGGAGASAGAGSSPPATANTAGAPNAEGLVNPLAAATGVKVGRTDQGVDIVASPGSPIGALGAGEIDAIIPDWFQGQPLVEERLSSGNHPFIYYAEQLTPTVRKGQKVSAGQPIGFVAQKGTGLEFGLGAGGGRTLAQATTGYTEGQATTAGQQFRALLAKLGLR